MKEVQADIEIAAPATVVWEILTDFRRYPEWNPFIRSIVGELGFGERLVMTVQPPGCRPWTSHPKILHVAPHREILMQERLLLPGLLDAEQAWLIEPSGGMFIRVSQRKRFSGLLLPLLRRLPDKILGGMEAMNFALKARAESAGRQVG
ncbi:MAG TPA: SRPBCC domain-containing protein [Nitrospirales bacterium]|nr:SRPBCC domain-containing protein [Nitrospirales bacterium]